MKFFAIDRRRVVGGFIVCGALAVGLGGCANGAPPVGDDANLEAGKQSYIESCGACHALEDAGTTSQIGPNLDDAFRGSRQQGFKDSAFAGVVEQWIDQPQPPMAAKLVVGVEAENVAAYVASVAGQSPDSTIRPEAPFVTRPPVPGGTPVAKAPPVLEEGQIVARPPGGESAPESGEESPAEGEGG